MAEQGMTIQEIEALSKSLNIPIEDMAETYGVDLKKKESTEPLSSQPQETPLDSTTQSTEEEPPKKKKRGSVVSKKPNQVQPSESSVGKEDKNVYYYNVNPKIGAVEKEPEVPKGYTTVKKVENSKEVELWKKQKANQEIGGFTEQLKEQKKRQKEYLQELSTKPMDRPKLKAVIDAENRMRNISFDETGKVKVKPIELPRIDFNDPSLYLDFDNLNEIDKQLSKVGVGIKTVKYGNMEFKANENTRKDFLAQEKNWYNSAKAKVGDISLSKEDLLKIDEDYLSEKNRTGVLDEVEDQFRQIANVAAYKATGEVGLVSGTGDNFSDIRADLMKEDPKFNSLKPEEKELKIKQRYIEVKQDALLLNKYYDAAEKLTPQERFAITKQSRNLLAATEKENKKLYDKFDALNLSLNGLIDKRDALIANGKKAKTKEEFAKIKADFDKTQVLISGYYNDLVNTRGKIYKTADKVNDLKIAVNGYNAETNEFIDIARRVKAWGYGAFANMLQLTKDFNKSLDVPFLGEKEEQERVQENIDYLKEQQEKTLASVRKVEEVTSISSAINEATAIFGDNLSVVATMTFGGGGGMALLGLEATGGQLRNLNDQNRAFKSALANAEDNSDKDFYFDGEKYNVEKNKGKDLFSDRQKWTSAVALGLAMQAPLAFQLKTIFNPVLKNTAPELLSKSFAENIVQQSGKFAKESLKLDLILRGTNVANGLNEKYILGKDFDFSKSWGGIDQTLHALIIHGMSVGTAHVKGDQATPYLTNKETSKVYKNSVRAKEIGIKLEDPNLSHEAKQILVKEGDALANESMEIVNKGIDRLSEMPVEDRNLVLDLTNKSNKIKTEAENVKRSDLPVEDKKIQLETLRREYKRVFDKIEEINTSNRKRNDGFFSLSGKEQQERIQKVKKELELKSGEPITDRDAKYKAILDYNAEVLKSDVYYYTTENGGKKPDAVPEGYTSMAEVKTKEDAMKYLYQEISNSKSVSELEAIDFDKRTDAEHAEFIQKKAADVLHQRGFLNDEIKVFLSVMKARAEASGLGNAWFRQIENITKGEFLNTDSAKYQLSVKHGTPHEFPQEVLVEKPDGTREYLVGTKDSMPKVPNNFKVIERYPNGRFRLDKMGTGEGAQAFGWGLYFTDMESIARIYADKLSEPQFTIDGKIVDLSEDIKDNGGLFETLFGVSEVGIDGIYKRIQDGDYYSENMSKKMLRHLQNIKGKKVKRVVNRSLYDVKLHKGKTPDQYTWLEWDKPMTDKDLELFQTFNKKQGLKLEESSEPVKKEDRITAGQMYNFMSNRIGQKATSLFLLENGIDGVKYPAESISRGATSDTARGFNYVVFDENAITVENKVKFQQPQKTQALDYKSISSVELDSKELNTIRASVRASMKDSFALEMLDAISKNDVIDFGEQELNETLEQIRDGKTTVNDIASIILLDEAFCEKKNITSRRSAIDYIMNVGEKGTFIKKATSDIKYQESETPQPLGAAETMESGRVVLHFFENANVSTSIHELGHVLENELTPEEKVIVTNWSGQESWNLETSERFARGLERYFYDGIAPTEKLRSIFDKAKTFMKNVYVSLKGTELEADIPKEARDVLDKIFTKEEPVKTETGKEVSLQERVSEINERVLESRKYDIIAGLIRDGVIKQKPC